MHARSDCFAVIHCSNSQCERHRCTFLFTGMHYGLRRVHPQAHVVGAFDLNEVANDVYEHNFGWRPWQARSHT